MSRRTYRSYDRGAMISLRCNLSYLDTIRQKLGNDNMAAMKASCFGHLFLISDLKFQGQHHNMLLRRLVNSSLKHLLLSFNINVDEIEKAFKAECCASAGCSKLSLKLAFLLILFGILLVRGSSNKNVDMTYLHLVDDIQMFQLFPWGEVAYDLVVRQTHRAKLTLDKLLQNDKKLQLDANGFSLALQVNDSVVANLQRRVAELEQYIQEMKTSRKIEVKSVKINRPGLRLGSSLAHMESNKPTVKSNMPKRSKKVSQGKRHSNLRMSQLRRPHLLCSLNPYDPNESEYLPDHVNAFEN